jgi:hypothetical protein
VWKQGTPHVRPTPHKQERKKKSIADKRMNEMMQKAKGRKKGFCKLYIYHVSC